MFFFIGSSMFPSMPFHVNTIVEMLKMRTITFYQINKSISLNLAFFQQAVSSSFRCRQDFSGTNKELVLTSYYYFK